MTPECLACGRNIDRCACSDGNWFDWVVVIALFAALAAGVSLAVIGAVTVAGWLL